VTPDNIQSTLRDKQVASIEFSITKADQQTVQIDWKRQFVN
jgi:hypothetical protein